jgi:hypothetical protein
MLRVAVDYQGSIVVKCALRLAPLVFDGLRRGAVQKVHYCIAAACGAKG